MNAEKLVWGDNGYVEITPPGMWLAVTIHQQIEQTPLTKFTYTVYPVLWRLAKFRLIPKRWLRRVQWWNALNSNPVEPFYTEIKPSHDEIGFVFRTKENSPWLPDDLIEAINYPHRKLHIHRLGVMTEFNQYFKDTMDKEENALQKETVLRLAYESNHQLSIFTNFGGFISKNDLVENDKYPITLNHLIYRQNKKNEKDFTTADLVRKSVTGGGITVEDKPTGTFFYYAA